ncbi:hypothetical protein HMI55_006119 [Coelomomyces lativittatus]|nr:hypothetical protein HMI55_006119 [Coelomomyces lativittatus]
MVVLSDHDKYSIHTLLNYNVIIMRENRPFDGIHNHEVITSPPVKKVVPPQKQEELTNRDVKFSPIDLGNGNIGSKKEVFTRDTAPLKTSKPEKIVNQAPPPVFNVQNPGTKKNDKNVHLPPEIRTTTTPVVPPRVVNVKTPNPTKNDMKAPLPPEDTPVTIVSSPPVDDKKPRYHTFGPPRLYNQRRNTQRNGVQPGATNSKKKEQIKPEANGVSHDKLEYEELLKKRKKAVKDSWRSGRNIDFEKLGLGLPEKFSAASKARKPNTTRNLIKRQVGNKKFYDIAFTLGRIEEIKSPRHAEQYLADVVNMLQWYYKKFNFNGYSVRLLSAYYLQQHKTLIDFQGLPKNVPIKYYFDTWNTLVNTNFPFQIYSPSFLLARKSKGSVITQYGRGMRSKKVCSRNSMRGVAFIKDEYVTDPYEMVNTLNHEIAYMTGIGHEGVDGCALEGKAMHPSRVAFIPWKAFSQCTLGKILCKP